MKRLFVALGLVVMMGSSASADESGATFVEVVKLHFKHWDRNQDGKLSAEEVDEGLRSPAVTGPSAAALAAVHVYQRGHRTAQGKKDWPAVSVEFLLRPEAKGDQGRIDQAQKQSHFQQNFSEFREHIKSAPRELFAKGAPTLTAFRQGHLGDCFFLATTAAMVHNKPAALKHMIRPQPDNSCDLVFGNGAKVHVRKLADGLIALGSSAGQQGLWLNVLEQGYGQLQMEHLKRPGAGLLALDEISEGGSPLTAIPIFTGHQAKRLAIRHPNGQLPGDKEAALLGRELRTLLERALEHKHLVCCGNFGGKHPPGIPTDHVFTVIGFEAKQDLIVVRNPWGNHFEPKGIPGIEHGYSTKDGVFRLTVAQFLHTFDGVSYEIDEPERR